MGGDLMKSLGLDLSSTVCGFAITEDKKLIDVGYFDISKVENYKDKAQIIIDGLAGKEFGRISVEENLSGFAFGKTSQQTILKLAKNKAVICYILNEHYHLPMVHANAVTMRKQLFGVSRIKGIKPKDFVKQKIETMYNMTPWIVLNRNGVPDKRMEDAYDAIVVSCYENHTDNV
jgi:Holliday junction resolvasome RuvABC endonuclease subunit